MRKTIWNTIPESNADWTTAVLANAHVLHCWQLSDMVDGVILEGYSHRRAGLPDGTRLCTSLIRSYRLKDGCLYFQTANSMYLCLLQEYVTESNSLAVLENTDTEMLLRQAAESRKRHFLSLLSAPPADRTLFMNWYGCDHPYLRWTVRFENGFIRTGEWECARSALETAPVCLTIENSGSKAICLPLDSSRALTVMPKTHVTVDLPHPRKGSLYAAENSPQSVRIPRRSQSPLPRSEKY